MPPKSKKSSTSKKVEKQEEGKSPCEIVEALCQNAIAKLERDFNAKMERLADEKETLNAKINDLIVEMNNLDAKMENFTDEFHLAVGQITLQVMEQMKIGDALKLDGKQLQEVKGATANAVDDESDSDSDMSIARQTRSQRARSNSADSAGKPTLTRSRSRAASLKKAGSSQSIAQPQTSIAELEKAAEMLKKTLRPKK